ncbi:hypothetical protein APU22_07085 [Klebsiella pneumoniae]|nr:hypothetical protein APU22_07085 [Klebsiella pneumoniae]
MGALSGVAEPARPSGRCKGGHSLQPVHRAGDEQVALLQIVGGDKLIIPFC